MLIVRLYLIVNGVSSQLMVCILNLCLWALTTKDDERFILSVDLYDYLYYENMYVQDRFCWGICYAAQL